METVNDLDGDLMNFWRVLRDRPAELERACALTPHSRAEYLACYEPATDDLERARRIWSQGFVAEAIGNIESGMHTFFVNLEKYGHVLTRHAFRDCVEDFFVDISRIDFDVRNSGLFGERFYDGTLVGNASVEYEILKWAL